MMHWTWFWNSQKGERFSVKIPFTLWVSSFSAVCIYCIHYIYHSSNNNNSTYMAVLRSVYSVVFSSLSALLVTMFGWTTISEAEVISNFILCSLCETEMHRFISTRIAPIYCIHVHQRLAKPLVTKSCLLKVYKSLTFYTKYFVLQ